MNHLQSWAKHTKPPKRPITPEGAVLKAITQYLRALRIGTVVRQQVGMATFNENRRVPYGELGASDLRVDLTGSTRSIFVEVKRPGGHASEHQEAYLARQRSRGHLACVVDSVTVLQMFLRENGVIPGRAA
jgi:hypothetical protein